MIQVRTLKKPQIQGLKVSRILSCRGKELLVVNNFKFCVHRKKDYGIRWRCTRKNKCFARIYTTHDLQIIDSYLVHNHEEESNIARQALSNSAKRRAIYDPTEKPANLIGSELQNFSDELTQKDIDRARKNVYRSRRIVNKATRNKILL